MLIKYVLGLALVMMSSMGFSKPLIDYPNETIQQISQLVSSKQISCRQLIQRYQQRILTYDLAHNPGQPPINSIIALNPFAVTEAAQIDRQLEQNKQLPMLCVPVVVKDNIDTLDTPTTCGSLSLLGSQPKTNAFIVNQMRAAGAIIIGKAGMDEFASGLSGINSRLGRTGNAYNTNLLPGGSSSGSAAAVSAGFAVVGIGTDNSGSLRVPAAMNGVYTIRAGRGMVSQQGIFPRGNLDGMAGPIAHNIKDVATVMDIIANPIQNGYRHYLNSDALKGKRIGVLVSYADKKIDYDTPAAKAIYKNAMKRFEKLGATLVPNIKLAEFNPHRKHNLAGEVQQINAYFKTFASTRKSFDDLCRSGRTITFGDLKECLAHGKDNPAVNSVVYRDVVAMFRHNKNIITDVMNKHHLDALLLPISKHGVPIAEFSTGFYTVVSPNAGLPAVEFIAGFTDGKQPLPVGMELLGMPVNEAKLLGMAYAYSKDDRRVTPKLMQPQHGNSYDSIARFNNAKTSIGYQVYKQLIQPKGNESVTSNAFLQVLKQLFPL
ncbi:MAG: amidase [Coxiellaceae bacterium]|nr:amidase [Coxiellaceae bacterium]